MAVALPHINEQAQHDGRTHSKARARLHTDDSAQNHGSHARDKRHLSILRSPRKGDSEENKWPRAPVLNRCFHLGSTYCGGVPDIEKIRTRKISKMKASFDEGGETDRTGATNPLSKIALMRSTAPATGGFGRAKEVQETSSGTRNFCGLSGPAKASISSTGSWYDSRPFSETERLGQNHQSARRKKAKEEGIGEGERFLLRRCKTILMRRHGTLNTALKRLDVEFARPLSLDEFSVATESLFKPSEARYIFCCLDKSARNLVSLEQLLNRLEELCLEDGGGIGAVPVDKNSSENMGASGEFSGLAGDAVTAAGDA